MRDRDFSEERQQKILAELNRKGRAEVGELARFSRVTETTIRRDLFALEKQGLIYRSHGGAIRREKKSIWQMSTLQARLSQHEDEKERIALCASRMVHDGESIMIDGGSTTTLLARHLGDKKNLLVVTNALTIAQSMAESEHNKVIIVGGELMRETNALLGHATCAALSSYRTDKAIIGVSGLIPGEGCFSAIPQEGEVKHLMLKNAQKRIIITDSSKIGTRAFYLFCDFTGINTLVTDKNIQKNDLAALKNSGIEIVIA